MVLVNIQYPIAIAFGFSHPNRDETSGPKECDGHFRPTTKGNQEFRTRIHCNATGYIQWGNYRNQTVWHIHSFPSSMKIP